MHIALKILSQTNFVDFFLKLDQSKKNSMNQDSNLEL
jgi:hypothetical protein